jgi:PAS domain S-box-containing protein
MCYGSGMAEPNGGEVAGASPSQPWTAEKVRALLLHSADIVSLLDAEGRLLFNSAAAERISGFSVDDLEGVDTFQFIHPEDQPAVAEAYQQVLARPGAVMTVQYRYRTKAGGWTWMEAVASNRLDDPEVRGVVANSRDISERKRAEEERDRLEAQLVHRQRLESLGTLAGGIAHDFNNLLSGLSAHVELAAAASTEPEVRAELDEARAVLVRAAAITRQLLGLARRQAASPVTFDLAEALARLGPLLQRLLGGRVGVELARPPGPLWVRLDPAQLEQVVVNLATNARDAMPDGGRLRLEARAVPPEAGEAAAAVALLEVADDGCGIAPEHLPRVLEPFFTTKEVGRGTGLGLSVTHGIVTQAGGTIRLDSRPGEGTTVRIRLPLAAPPAAADAAAGRRAVATRARPGERVLLADDDDQVRRATGRMLRWLGWDVDEARDGEEAVEAVRAAPGAHAAAVLDLRMPRLGGLEAAERLAELAPDLPMVLVTGYAEGVEGRDDVLVKPYDAATLGERLREAIDRRLPARGP